MKRVLLACLALSLALVSLAWAAWPFDFSAVLSACAIIALAVAFLSKEF